MATNADARADYLIVAGHYPVYSIGLHGPSDCLVKGLLPLLDKYNVNAYMSGHDHNLQHLRTQSSTGKNIDYFVSGMADLISWFTFNIDSVPDGSSLFFEGSKESMGGFMVVEATASNMTMTFINGLGQRIYSTNVFPRK